MNNTASLHLKGYILEEVVAYLIRESGYKLIADESQDPENLKNGRAGLEVRGKGGYHQADSLGQLNLISAFTYPVRLFVEAKFYGAEKRQVDLPLVRTALGVITDVRNAPPLLTKAPFPQNYKYEYVFFSATGFDEPASKMALAHQISLVDLSGPDYKELLDAVKVAAEKIKRKYKGPNIVNNTRKVLRSELNTVEERFMNGNGEFHDFQSEIRSALSEVLTRTKEFNKLYVGTADAPFVIILKPSSVVDFENYSLSRILERTEHKVTISWSSQNEKGRIWTVRPVDNPGAYKLTFRIPQKLFKWIFANKSKRKAYAMNAKNKYFSTIYVYLQRAGIDYVIKLKFDAEETIKRYESDKDKGTQILKKILKSNL